jgi:hypothetical protein
MGSLTTATKTKMMAMVPICLFGTCIKALLLPRHDSKVWGTKNDRGSLLHTGNKELIKPFNGLFDHTKQEQDDAFGFRLFVWAMKQKVGAVMM